MKILFVMRSTLYVRNFESTLRLLAERGREVHIVAQPHSTLDPGNHAGRLAAEYPGIVHEHPPVGPLDGWALLSEELRRGVHYLRYLRPEYRNAPKLRRRSLSYAPPFILRATRHAFIRSAAGLAVARRVLRFADRALPMNPVVFDFVRGHNPDLVIVTPLVEPGSPQSQYLRAARALGIRTVLCVHSWDNLTNKGLIQDPLDLVTVWNEPMKREAVALHGVPSRRVELTGAPNYDLWFEWTPRGSSSGRSSARAAHRGSSLCRALRRSVRKLPGRRDRARSYRMRGTKRLRDGVSETLRASWFEASCGAEKVLFSRDRLGTQYLPLSYYKHRARRPRASGFRGSQRRSRGAGVNRTIIRRNQEKLIAFT